MADPTINVKINGDSSGLHREMDKSKQGVMGLASELKGLAAAIGIGFGIGQIVSFGRSLLNTADAARDTAKGLGESLQNVVALQRLAAQAGVDQDKVYNWLQRVRQVQDDIINSNGTSEISKKLTEQLGINLTDLANASPAEAITMIMQAADKAGNSVKILNEMFGRLAAVDLKDALGRLVTEGLKPAADEAKNLADSMNRVADAKDRLDKVSSGLKETAMNKASDFLEFWKNNNQSMGLSDWNPLGLTTAGLINGMRPRYQWAGGPEKWVNGTGLEDAKKEPVPVTITGIKPGTPEAKSTDYLSYHDQIKKETESLAAQAKVDAKLAALDARAEESRQSVLERRATAIDAIQSPLPRLSGVEALGGIMGGTGGYAVTMADRMKQVAEITAASNKELMKIESNTASAKESLKE